MTTVERARALAIGCRGFEHLLGEASAEEFLEWVRVELGHEGVLDGFQQIGGEYLHAVAPRVILHIVSGNTPHAALQSLIRGLLLGSNNLCKLPSERLPEVEAFVAALPDGLRSRVGFRPGVDARGGRELIEGVSVRLPREFREQFPLAAADAIIVFGSDETVAHFRALALPEQIFLGYGHRVSLGIVFEDPTFESAQGSALDASLFDQQGCLSPHCIYVADRPEEYAARLAVEMGHVQAEYPATKLSLSEAAGISEIRETSRFRAAAGQNVRLWEGDGWTVIFDADPVFSPSPLNRVIFVRPVPDDMAGALTLAQPFLSTIAIWPNTQKFAEKAAGLGASRICALGRMQEPAWMWRQDGRQTLAPLVTWKGWEA